MISVILPVNKDDGFLEEAINSILKQTYKSFELLVIANNCEDKLWEYLLCFAEKDNRVKPYRLSLGGLTFALNFGINISNRKYIARMDADDVCVENRLEEQMFYLESHPEIALVGSLAGYIDSFGAEVNRKCLLPETHSGISKTLMWKSAFIHPSIMARKEFFDNLGGYKFGFYGEDYELWLRGLFAGYKYHNIQQKLIKYRIHSKQLSSYKINNDKTYDLRSMLYHKKLVNKRTGLFLGMLVQTRIIQRLIIASSKVRNVFKK